MRVERRVSMALFLQRILAVMHITMGFFHVSARLEEVCRDDVFGGAGPIASTLSPSDVRLQHLNQGSARAARAIGSKKARRC